MTLSVCVANLRTDGTTPDSEEIEPTVPKAHRRNFPGVKQIQDNCLYALSPFLIATRSLDARN